MAVDAACMYDLMRQACDGRAWMEFVRHASFLLESMPLKWTPCLYCSRGPKWHSGMRQLNTPHRLSGVYFYSGRLVSSMVEPQNGFLK